MAKQVIMAVVDDLDGRELAPADAHTVQWSWRGVDYRLDVSSANLDRIEQGKVTIARLLEASSRVSGVRRRGRGRRRPPSAADKERRQAIRAWGQEHGYEISDRGRISQDVIDAYDSALAAR